MPLASAELARARELTSALLERMGLEQYLFEIEPKEGEWQLRLECAAEGSWNSLSLGISKDLLLASADDAGLFERLLDEWRGRLAECKLSGPEQSSE